MNKIKTNSNIKFVICSSINDTDIKLEYKNTIIKFKRNPDSFNINTQNYYFYFTFLYKPAYKVQDKYYLLFKLFGFMQKYQNMFINCKDNELGNKINEIDTKIKGKLKICKSSSSKINIEEINLYDSLMVILQNLDIDINYKKLIKFYDILPLKYFYFEFKSNCFSINYLFEYIVIYIKKMYNNINYKQFFEKEDWMKDEIKSNIKGQYFEKSAIKSIKENKIQFEKKYNMIIKLNEICSMDYEVKDKLSEAIKRIIINDNSQIIDDNEINNIIENEEKNDKSEIIIKNNNEEKKDKIEENENAKNISENKEDIQKNKSKNKDDDNSQENESENKDDDNSQKNESENKEDDNSQKNESENKEDDNSQKNESARASDIIIRRCEKVKEIINKNYENNSRELQKCLSKATYKENLLDINDFKKNINLFERLDNRKRIKITNHNNNSILIEQDKINGRCIDMAMIWTNMENKNIFIGFQMKCFREYTKGGNASNISKMLIKCNYLDILMNSEELLGIKIDEWHYVMILFCSHRDKEKNEICKYLVNKCIKNRIKYIFYDPVEELFYNKDLKEIKDVFILLDNDSNLDYGNNFSVTVANFNKSPGSYFLGKKRQLSSGDLIKGNKEELQSFKEFLKKNGTSFLKFKNNLKDVFKDIDKIEFKEKIETFKLELLTPNIGSIFCYKGKKNEILLILKRDDDNGVEYYNLNKKQNYKIIWEFGLDIDEINYFYLLNFTKKNN